jgi:hypothetical protein
VAKKILESNQKVGDWEHVDWDGWQIPRMLMRAGIKWTINKV